MSLRPATTRATKAQVAFITAANTWAATWLPPIWAGLGGIFALTYLAWLVPNNKTVTRTSIAPAEWGAPPPEETS